MSSPRVALVHDWLTGMRGGERVLESLCRIFPAADLCTLVHLRGSVSPLITARRVRTSFVQWLPSPGRLYRHYLPLFPAAIEQFDLDEVDVVVSTSHCAAKSVVVPGRAVHICYCHSPMRYAWDQFDQYFGVERVGRWQNAALRPVLAWLARWDRGTAHRVTRYVANSRYVAGRIARYYNRRASVLHPPVDTAFFTPGGEQPSRYFLVVSALVPYKRIDIAIRAAARIGWPLKIVGTGPDEARLRAIAGPGVQFTGALDGAGLREAYRGAQALLVPGEEDFGIAAVESLACGRPVVALGRGGVCESIDHGVSGVLIDDDGVEAFAAGLEAVTTLSVEPARLRARAEALAPAHFEASFRALVAETLADPRPC